MSDAIISSIVSGIIAIISILSSACIAIFSPLRLYRKQKVYDERLRILIELYGKVSKTSLLAESYMSPLNRDKGVQKKLSGETQECFNDMGDYYLRNRVLLSSSVTTIMDRLFIAMKGNLIFYEIVSEYSDGRRSKKMNEAWEDKRLGNVKKIEQELESVIRSEIEANKGKRQK